MIKQKPIGQILVDKGLISDKDVEFILNEKYEGELFLEALDRLKIFSGDKNLLWQSQSDQLGVPFYLEGKDFAWDKKLIINLDVELAMQHKVLPLWLKNNFLCIAMDRPQDIPAIEAIRMATGYHIRTAFVGPQQFAEGFKVLYDLNVAQIDDIVSEDSLSDQIAAASREQAQQSQSSKSGKQDEELVTFSEQQGALNLDEEPESDSKPVRLLHNILLRSVISDTSDIHIEPGEKTAKIRFRIDGFLQEITKIDTKVYLPMITTIKVQAAMDISERRLPQDGRFSVVSGGQSVDLRISSMPTVHGEKIVIRLLRRGTGILRLDRLGLDQQTSNAMRQAILTNNGMVLITGPTGSGKSTTLYALLREVDLDRLNVITIEDPVEYEMAKVTQVNVRSDIGLTFATILRTVLRQDPDVVMVGEIRDLETAEMATRAALTGHLVFSTLHTNSAPATIDRLLEMGIPSYLLGSSLQFIGAQRLARRICPHCQEAYTPASNHLAMFAEEKLTDINFVHGRGCDECGQTGYKGRLALLEYLTIDREIARMISQKILSDKIREQAEESGKFVSIIVPGLKAVKKGETTLEELRRVMGEG